jgi:hypothetical protein
MLESVRPRLVIRVTRRVLLAAVCALAAHVAAYGTLWPKDDGHGYLSWYEPLVAGLSLVAIAGLVVLLAFVFLARRLGRRFHLPGPPPPQRPLGALIVEIGGSGLAYLVVQESVERSVAAGTPLFASFTPSQWLVVFAGLVSAALVLACAMRLGETIVESVLSRTSPPAERRCARAWSVIVGDLRRGRPLALCSALRAPPILLPA